MCSLLLIPAPEPQRTQLLFLQRQSPGFPKEPHCTLQALLGHGLLDPGSLEAKAPRHQRGNGPGFAQLPFQAVAVQ